MSKGKSKRWFLRGALTCLLLVVLGAVTYWYLFWHRPIGSGPAGPSVPNEEFEQAWSNRPVLLVGFGDSMTTGFGAGPGKGYFDRLAANPPDEYADMQGKSLQQVFPNLKVLNVAVSGSTSLQAESVELNRIPLQDKETLGWVVITTGGNDIIHNYGRGPVVEGAMYGASWAQAEPWVKSYRERLDRLVAAIKLKFPGGCEIFIANIYDPTDGKGDIENANVMLPSWRDGVRIHTAYNQAIADCAEQNNNVHLVDIYSLFLGHGIHCHKRWSKHYRAEDPHYWYYFNLEDPNHRGYDAMRRLFLLRMIDVASSLKESTANLTNGGLDHE